MLRKACDFWKNQSLDFQIVRSRTLFGLIQWDRYHMKAVCLYFLVFSTFLGVLSTKHRVFSKTRLAYLAIL